MIKLLPFKYAVKLVALIRSEVVVRDFAPSGRNNSAQFCIIWN